MKINILRGENELTGNLIEISTLSTKILVECGISLDGEKGVLSQIEKQVLSTQYDAVVISHNHLDHNGLISKVKKSIPIYMGKYSLKMCQLQKIDSDYTNYRVYYDNSIFTVGDISITPFLCDHSAPDSYMLLFESGGQTILYTGDFRGNGRKDYSYLLNKLPNKVNLLITEGTNLASNIQSYSETKIEEKISELLAKTDKPVFVLCSTTNIDRIVSCYKASIKNKRDFFVDIEQEKMLELFGKSVPNAKTFDKVKVYYPKRISDFSNFCDVKNKSVSINDLANKNNYMMVIKSSSLPYLKKLNKLGSINGATLIYSMWTGYQEKENMKRFLTEIKNLGINIEIHHTSGHADKTAIIKLIEKVHPKQVRYVHTK